MVRPSVIIAMLVMAGAIGGFGYIHTSRTAANSPSSITTATTQVTVETPPAIETKVEETIDSRTQPAADNVPQWIADTQSSDAQARAAAIDALANAPKAQAVRALERVLETGEPQVDRQIALRSLHTLALNDGDEDGAIRDVIRHAMYHSDDEGVTQSAQAVLEDIEAEFAERGQKRSME